jgi:hypothetical protein
MSTRANIVIREATCRKKYNRPLWFYRHSDGYPSGAMPTLVKFVEWIKAGKIRNSVSQSAGWLIIIGAEEYDKIGVRQPIDVTCPICNKESVVKVEPTKDRFDGWKVGAYEPTQYRHCDIEYLYVINVVDCTIRCYITTYQDKEEVQTDEGVCPSDKLLFTWRVGQKLPKIARK